MLQLLLGLDLLSQVNLEQGNNLFRKKSDKRENRGYILAKYQSSDENHTK